MRKYRRLHDKRDVLVLAAVRGVLRAGAPWPGGEWIGQRIRCSQPSVSRSMNRLRGRGLIDFDLTCRGLKGLRVLQTENARSGSARLQGE